MARAGALMLLFVLSAVAAPTLGMRMGSAQKDFNKLVSFLKMKKNGYTSLLGALASQGEELPAAAFPALGASLPCPCCCPWIPLGKVPQAWGTG